MMILATVAEGEFIDANEAFCTSNGYTREEIIGRTTKELNFFVDMNKRRERGKTIIEQGRLENGKVVLAIADEGCGMRPENLSKMGIPFFTTKDTGTGLGLASCYKIAESHNAKIDINSSSRGQHSLFFFLFLIKSQYKMKRVHNICPSFQSILYVLKEGHMLQE